MRSHNRCCLFLALMGLLLVATGCQSVLNVQYNPSQAPVYSTAAKDVVATIATVSDKRGADPTAYYRHQNDLGCYNRPVADLVREAVDAECRRAGFLAGNANGTAVTLSCDVLDYKAAITDPILFTPGTLDLSVLIAFEWRNSQTGQLLARNERSEHRSRKLEGLVPTLPFGEPVIQDYGRELYNEVLPLVIATELQSFSASPTAATNAWPYRVVSYQYDDKGRRGTISVETAGHAIEARDWLIKNIGRICSSKDLLMEAGRENQAGGHYRVLNESVKDGILTIEFSAGFDDRS